MKSNMTQREKCMELGVGKREKTDWMQNLTPSLGF